MEETRDYMDYRKIILNILHSSYGVGERGKIDKTQPYFIASYPNLLKLKEISK